MSSTCQDLAYPYGHHPANQVGVDGSSYPFGECTDFIWRYYREQGVQVYGYMGDATEWARAADVQHYAVYDRLPGANVIACWDASAYPPFGHVGAVVAADADGFTVHEFNFCYDVKADPGHADRRQVAASDPQPKAFILPTGAGLGQGTPSQMAPGGGLIGAVQGELQGVATAIEHAGLQVEADLMTFRQRVTSGGQMGLGAAIALAGGGVLVLSALGHSPSAVASAGARRVSRVTRRQALPAVRAQFPESTPQLPVAPAGRPVRIPAARASRILVRRP